MPLPLLENCQAECANDSKCIGFDIHVAGNYCGVYGAGMGDGVPVWENDEDYNDWWTYWENDVGPITRASGGTGGDTAYRCYSRAAGSGALHACNASCVNDEWTATATRLSQLAATGGTDTTDTTRGHTTLLYWAYGSAGLHWTLDGFSGPAPNCGWDHKYATLEGGALSAYIVYPSSTATPQAQYIAVSGAGTNDANGVYQLSNQVNGYRKFAYEKVDVYGTVLQGQEAMRITFGPWGIGSSYYFRNYPGGFFSSLGWVIVRPGTNPHYLPYLCAGFRDSASPPTSGWTVNAGNRLSIAGLAPPPRISSSSFNPISTTTTAAVTPVVATATAAAAAPATKLTLVADVTGTTTANDTFWAAKCGAIPATALFVRLKMGTAVDHFKPVNGASWCDMLTSANLHQWSRTGLDGSWVVPGYVSSSDYNGGSANDYPLRQFYHTRNTAEGENSHCSSGCGGCGCCGGEATCTCCGGACFPCTRCYPGYSLANGVCESDEARGAGDSQDSHSRDIRAFLSFWGRENRSGGCCSTSTDVYRNDGDSWGLPFALFYGALKLNVPPPPPPPSNSTTITATTITATTITTTNAATTEGVIITTKQTSTTTAAIAVPVTLAAFCVLICVLWWIRRDHARKATAERDAFEQEELSRNTVAMAANPLASPTTPTATSPSETGHTATKEGNETSTEMYYSTIAETQLDGSGYVVDSTFRESEVMYATYAASHQRAGGSLESVAYATLATDGATYAAPASAHAYAIPVDADAGPMYTIPLQHGGVAYAQSRAGGPPAGVYAAFDSSA